MIITFASSKGGVGKSTTCACLAGAIAFEGRSVHIVDIDANRTIGRWLEHQGHAKITVSAPTPAQLTEHLEEITRTVNPDIILIDVAGAFEQAITVAMARANLTIIPAAPTEADLHEANRIAAHLRGVFAAFRREPVFRVLLTQVQALGSHAQAHAFREVERLGLPRFATTIGHRAAYQEIGFSGAPPHLASPARPTTTKAIAEIDALWREIGELIAAPSHQGKIAA